MSPRHSRRRLPSTRRCELSWTSLAVPGPGLGGAEAPSTAGWIRAGDDLQDARMVLWVTRPRESSRRSTPSHSRRGSKSFSSFCAVRRWSVLAFRRTRVSSRRQMTSFATSTDVSAENESNKPERGLTSGSWAGRWRGAGEQVPVISMFFGIIVRMFYQEHEPAHFHAEYQGQSGTFDFDAHMTAGDIRSRTALRLIEEWAASHRPELEANWRRIKAGRPLERIPPLE